MHVVCALSTGVSPRVLFASVQIRVIKALLAMPRLQEEQLFTLVLVPLEVEK